MSVLRVKSVSDYHKLRDLPAPSHPLISIIDFRDIKVLEKDRNTSYALDLYSIALKRNFSGKFRYGQQEYDFDEGILFFMAPGQVFSINANGRVRHTGKFILVHPDFLWNTSLAKNIKQFEFFDYAVHEALFLSKKEEDALLHIIADIEEEYYGNTDGFSQEIIIAQLELFLRYSDRFYQRQFLTRRITNHKVLAQLETLLDQFFVSDRGEVGIPTVHFIANELNISPNYLSNLLKLLTGQSTQQHIHNKMIEIAKQQLSTTQLSVSEIAYALGFEHPQSFSKLFKNKTSLSPLEFRKSFN